jgi:hypothetical protein
VLPNYLNSIDSQAFYNCTGLTSLNISSQCALSTIGDSAFSNCNNMTGTLNITSKLTAIGTNTFSGCKFTDVTCSSIFYFKLATNVGSAKILIKGSSATFDYTKAAADQIASGIAYGNLTIPAGTTAIGNSAFSGCAGLTGKLVIPNSVLSIGNSAFSSCTGLIGTLTMPSGASTIGSNAFYNCSGFTGALVIPGNVSTIGDNAFAKCIGITDVTSQSGSFTLAQNVGAAKILLKGSGNTFDFSKAATEQIAGGIAFGSLTIPSGTTTIGNNTFSNCPSLTGNLVFPASVNSIGNSAFSGCVGLKGNLVIPDAVTSIGNSAFSGCTGFVALYLGSSVTSIGTNAFDSNSELTTIIGTGNFATFSNFVFANCAKIAHIEFAS